MTDQQSCNFTAVLTLTDTQAFGRASHMCSLYLQFTHVHGKRRGQHHCDMLSELLMSRFQINVKSDVCWCSVEEDSANDGFCRLSSMSGLLASG